MAKVHAPWSASELDERIAAFIQGVQAHGYRRALSSALKDVQIFKRLGKQELLLKCLEAVARADGELGERELQLCERVKGLLEEVAV